MPARTIHVPKSKHGAIIGPRGREINSIRDELDCHVTIPRDDTTGVMLEAQEAAALDAAQARICEIIGMQVGEEQLRRMELGVEESEFGRVIGQKGSTLRSIQSSAGCVVMVPSDRNPEITHLTLEGTDAACHAGKALVEDALGRVCAIVGDSAESSQGMLSPEQVVKYVQRTESQNHVLGIHETLMFPDNDPNVNKFNRFLDYLRSSQQILKACVFTVTDSSIASVLIHLHEAGVKVQLITEDSTVLNSGSQIERLVDAGIEVKVDDTPYLMHHKYAVMDSQCLLTGSFNWTREAATHNSENIIFTNNSSFVSTFEQSFDELWNGTEVKTLSFKVLKELEAADFSHRPRHTD